ncbi:MAG: AmmeMemoRadiSam system protein A [Acidobacteriia bacterium]|nr:AmmeMemoRadiSam system protein A [Terriglobia bacterium]
MPPLMEADQRTLLGWAREALEESVRHHRLTEIAVPSGPLAEPRGAFVTLRKGDRLRGCIGYVEALKPLCLTVRECAMAAALQDPRFEPVTPRELPSLHMEISVLSPLEDITPEQIDVGRHGLIISRGRQRGLLLPQVAVEWNWDRERFLEETCVKAGLPPDDWKHGARLQAFTAQILEEPLNRAPSSRSSAA